MNEEEKLAYGEDIASSLGMKKEKNGYYLTYWGVKSGIGIVEIIKEIAESIKRDFPEIEGRDGK